MGNVRLKKKRHETSITFIVTKAVYGIGFSILALTFGAMLFLSVTANNHIFNSEVFPIVEGVVFWSYIALVLLLTVIIPFLTSRKLRKNGESIFKITEAIKDQNLDFQVSYGKVKEINDILESMDKMRMSLKESLEKPWNLEQTRKNQISAIVHDFKTPMTIMKGNIDLIECSEGSQICREYIEDAKFSLVQMETYLDILINMTRAENGYAIKTVKCEGCSLINKIVSPLTKIAHKKNDAIKNIIVSFTPNFNV